MLHILGCKCAENKLEPPKEVAEVLGEVLTARRCAGSGELKYVIKESRRTEDLPSVLGKIQFADGQLTGRAGKLAMAWLTFEKLD